MLTEPDLSSMRSTLDESLPGTAVVKFPTFVDNQGGGGTQTFTASGTVACRIASISGTEREIADRISADADWVVTLPALTSIDTDHRIETGGGTFSVVAMRAPHSYEVSRRVEVRRLT